MHTNDLIIIGAGPAGMIAAISAAQTGADVLLLEKNHRIGEKLRITGGGRCNITNDESDLRKLLPLYTDSEKFLYSAYTKFGTQDTRNFFTELGLETKVEAKQRVFPVSESAEDVVEALAYGMQRAQVTIETEIAVSAIKVSAAGLFEIHSNNGVFTAKKVIMATGGTSRPETGSTGEGFEWLELLGHSNQQPTPNITPLSVKGSDTKLASGTRAMDAQVSFLLEDTRKFKVRGDVLFTHFGLSGPTILNSAYKVADLLHAGSVKALIDFMPDTSEADLHAQIIAAFEANPSKQLKNVLSVFSPDGFTALIAARLEHHFDTQTKTSEISKLQRTSIVECIKKMSFEIEGLMGFEKAVVADGGIPLKEINMRTMESQVQPGLYITGDLLDINRPTGGYSLQLAWTSGFIAGQEAAKSLS